MSAIATRRWCRIYGCGREADTGSEFCSSHRHAAGEDDGRELLDRLDAGERLGQAPELEQKPKIEEAEAGTDGNVASASSIANGRRHWTPELVIEAIVRWTDEHGHAPTQRDWPRSGERHPAFSTAAKLFGTWGKALEVAGVEPRKRGGRRKSSSEASPVAKPKPRPKKPASTGADFTLAALTGDQGPALITEIRAQADRLDTRAAALRAIAEGLEAFQEASA